MRVFSRILVYHDHWIHIFVYYWYIILDFKYSRDSYILEFSFYEIFKLINILISSLIQMIIVLSIINVNCEWRFSTLNHIFEANWRNILNYSYELSSTKMNVAILWMNYIEILIYKWRNRKKRRSCDKENSWVI